MMERKPYPSDLTDQEWQLMAETLPRRNRRGRPPTDRREFLHAILYVLWTGCPWRALPRDLPHSKTVDTVFWRWRQSEAWQNIHHSLYSGTCLIPAA